MGPHAAEEVTDASRAADARHLPVLRPAASVARWAAVAAAVPGVRPPARARPRGSGPALFWLWDAGQPLLYFAVAQFEGVQLIVFSLLWSRLSGRRYVRAGVGVGAVIVLGSASDLAQRLGLAGAAAGWVCFLAPAGAVALGTFAFWLGRRL